MTQTPFKRVKRTLIIHLVVQIFFLALLVVMALNFQVAFQKAGYERAFLNSIIFCVVLQLLGFYPLKKLAEKEARREVATDRGSVDPATQKALRQGRMFSDIIKASIVIFFVVFIVVAPQALFVLATTSMTFLLLVITYLQCFNFAARREMRG